MIDVVVVLRDRTRIPVRCEAYTLDFDRKGNPSRLTWYGRVGRNLPQIDARDVLLICRVKGAATC